jgi:hypothetical protein
MYGNLIHFLYCLQNYLRLQRVGRRLEDFIFLQWSRKYFHYSGIRRHINWSINAKDLRRLLSWSLRVGQRVCTLKTESANSSETLLYAYTNLFCTPHQMFCGLQNREE